MNRRRFIGRGGAMALGMTALGSALAGCSIEGEAAHQVNVRKSVTVNHPKAPIDGMRWANWPLYIDKKSLRTFDRRYGTKVDYVEEINDNFEFFGKVRQQLAQGQNIGRDIVTLTDYMAARWVRDGYVEPIDKRNVPNMRNLVSNLKTINYDPNRDYTLPWQSGGTGIGYNPKKTGRRLESVNDLFDPAFKGRVTFLSEPYDSACLVALGMGIDAVEGDDRRDREGHRQDRHRPRTAARSAASPATTTRPTSPRATSGSRWPTRATSSSCRPTTPTWSSSSPRRAPCCSPTT